MADKFAMRPRSTRNKHGDKPSYTPVRAKVVDTGRARAVKHGLYSNLYSIRDTVRYQGRMQSIGHGPRPRSTEGMGTRKRPMAKSVAFRGKPQPVAGPVKDGQLLAAMRAHDTIK